MRAPWAVTAEKVQAAIERIVEVSQPRKLIVFGSYARGATHRDSDLDILVVTAGEVENPRKESIRIRRALRGLSMPVDILVIGEAALDEVAESPGLIYREAVRHGQVVYESA